MKSLRPKKLNFDEMWQVHKKYTNNENSLIDAANLLYVKRTKTGFNNLIVQVINGLNYNSYYSFVEFIKGLSYGNR